MNNKLISVIIPCYNVAKYLPKCLDSIINQTYKNLEIICVNDGSPDNCLEILENYKMKDDRIVIISQKNQGLSSARNTGIKCAKGEFIMFVDSDDWIDERTCEIAINKALSNDYDMVIWNYVREFPNNSLPKRIFNNEEIVFNKDDVIHRLYRRTVGLYKEELSQPENADSIVTVWGKLYKAKIILDNKLQFVDLEEIGTSEDALFNLEIYKYIDSAIYIPDCLYHYRKDNDNSVTSSYNDNLIRQWDNLFSVIDNHIKANNLDEAFCLALDNRICLSIIGLGLNVVDAGKNIKKIKEIKKIISSSRYRKAYKNLTLKYFPIHWKVFFALAKCNCSIGVYIMLLIIKMLIGK